MSRELIRIGKDDFKVERVRGRLFLNSQEHGAICHLDRRTIEFSDLLNPTDAAVAVGNAVSALWLEHVTALVPLEPVRLNADEQLPLKSVD